jgi:endonuclease YncB( thermonuclease family)
MTSYKPKFGMLLAALIGASAPAAGQTVTDGDTLKMNGRTYQLWLQGIESPEIKKTCADGRKASKEATKAMKELVRGRHVLMTDQP